METREIKALYMGWRESDPELPQQWVPIYRISWDGQGNYYYSYTKGFEANYQRLRSMIFNPDAGYKKLWHLTQLSPNLINRIPHRPDTLDLYDFLGIPEAKGKRDTITYLSRSLGRRNNDDYDFFPEVAPNKDGNYEFYFLCDDIAYFIKDNKPGVKEFADNVTGKELLTIETDVERTKILCQDLHIGYCPDYVHFFLSQCPVKNVTLSIAQINRQDSLYGGWLLLKCEIEPIENKTLYSHPFLLPLNSMPC
ncbi:MAG: hypothetical protein QNJ60_00330 [Xenococcaceae cyanobacterium MO_188.B19]|nr:hypothetical protein [Xenococcaceae cyanobacterium MO_188.B19]